MATSSRETCRAHLSISWDAFLGELMTGSRAALGPQWQEIYLQAPIWRFTLAAGHAGVLPAAGVLMPSVDRVGRDFPLTIAAVSVPGVVDLNDGWFERAEALALEILGDGFDPASLGERIGTLGAPESGGEPDDDLAWSSPGSAGVEPLGFRAASLPQGLQCAALLDCDFARWGWKIEPMKAAQHSAEAPPTQ